MLFSSMATTIISSDNTCNYQVLLFHQVQSPVKAFPTSAKITGFDTSPKDPYPVMFHLFKAR